MAASIRRSLQNTKALWYLGISRSRNIRGSIRNSSSFLNLNHHDDGVVVMEMSKKPVNSFSLEYLNEINATLTELENNQDCRGLIISSSMPKVFSAGLDLVKELHNPDESRLGLFWRGFQEMWLQLYGSRLVTIAAVNGHAIAGGCLMATACDYRLMASNFTIGMNETLVGIAVPWWVAQGVVNVVGKSVGEKACVLGTMFTTEEALKVGLIDRVVMQDEIMAEAHKEMKLWISVPEKGRAVTKQVLRRELIQKLLTDRDDDVKRFVAYIMQDSVQNLLSEQISRMTRKK